MQFTSTRRQGDAGVAAATLFYALRGYPAMMPIGEGQRYDLVVDLGGKLKRIQCKTTTYKTPAGTYEVELRTCGGNRSGTGKQSYLSSDEVDYVSILDGDGDLWFFPITEVEGKSRMCLTESLREKHVLLHTDLLRPSSGGGMVDTRA